MNKPSIMYCLLGKGEDIYSTISCTIYLLGKKRINKKDNICKLFIYCLL